ncbi:MAG: CRISPR-associated protein Cas4 [Candidatus Thorarchaeota archaeon]
MVRRYHSSEHADVTEQYLTPTDIKQYVFCPRVTYFTRVMRLKPIMGSQQEESQKMHERLADLEKRRESLLKKRLPFTVVKKEFEVSLRSDRLRVRGKADLIVTTDDGEIIPIEFKAMASRKRQLHIDHKYQLIVLALLIEEARETTVRRGFVHYMSDESTVELRLTDNLRRMALTYLRRIEQMIESGTLPPPRRTCFRARVGCGYADRCADL